MAFRNAVKATLLSELESPRPDFDEADAMVEAPAPESPIAKPPHPSDEAFLAAAWHRRAEELCAMAETLPTQSAWSQISKIARLYDEIAREAGWSAEEDTLPCAELCLEEPQAEAAPPTLAPLPEPPPQARAAFRRRPLPSGRPIPRRRA
jgi:hypothetical protein